MKTVDRYYVGHVEYDSLEDFIASSIWTYANPKIGPERYSHTLEEARYIKEERDKGKYCKVGSHKIYKITLVATGEEVE